MRAVVQRVSQASVTVDERIVGTIEEPGLVVLVGVTHTDTPGSRPSWPPSCGTCASWTGKSRAPTWPRRCSSSASSRSTRIPARAACRRWPAAAPGPVAEPLVEAVVCALRELGARVETGVFGADMKVSLVNDGPVTIIVEL